MLDEYILENGWHTERFEQGVSVNNKSGYQKKKVEVLTRNYEI